jgi:hypothetical protein
MEEATDYEKKIIKAFQDVCASTKEGASPHDVTKLLVERGELSEMDGVLDIVKIMRDLRKRGLL